MALGRGDIIDVFFEFPKVKNTTTHPAIIISNQEVYDADDGYICVIMTSSNNFVDKFTFELTDEMLQNPNNKKFSQARCHMVTFVHENHIYDKYPKNTLKPNSVERLIAHINQVSFSDDY
jgi:mRNA interferase MazF